MTTSPLDRFDSAGLGELNAAAALQTRIDRKYVLSLSALDAAMAGMSGSCRALDIDGRRRFGYESTYFDTPEFDCYFAAERSRPHRFKVRARSYVDSDVHVLEVKTRDRGALTVKTRQAATPETHQTLDAAALDFIGDTLADQLGGRADTTGLPRLEPRLRTSYQRTTLLLEADPSDERQDACRVTIDTSLEFDRPGKVHRSAPELVVVETKSPGPPSVLDRRLWSKGHRPLKISKYGTGLALLTPALPANKWNRVLRQNFGWAPVRGR